METRGEAYRDPQQPTELLSEHGRELGTTVRDDVYGDTMKAEDVLLDCLHGLLGGQKLGEWDKVCHLAEPIHLHEDDRHPIQGRQSVQWQAVQWRPAGCWLKVLLWLQTRQARTYSRVSPSIVYHQNRWARKRLVRPAPG